MLRTKKLRKQKKKARSRALKYILMLAAITAAGVALIIAIAVLWPSGTKTATKSTKKKAATTKTETKKPVKKPVTQPVKKPATASPPPLTIEEPPDGFETSQNTAVIKGSTSPDCTLLVDGKKYVINQDGTFNVSVDLVRGINRFVMTSVSAHKKTTEKEVVINKIR